MRAFDHDPRLRFFVGDVRDRDRLFRAMHDIDVVVHAAALKHVPICEFNPAEAVKTNIQGSQNVIDAAIDAGVQRTVALSTDKAVNPVNLYGATKLCAEKLFVHGNVYAGSRDIRFSCVRYGNVMGSRGSVIPLFRKQAAENGRLTVTDRRMTRFWLSLDHAVDVVLNAMGEMAGGEVFVPKIPSMRVTDLARAIAPTAAIEEVGRRPGEKLHEVLLTAEEARHAEDRGRHFVVWPEHEQGRRDRTSEPARRLQLLERFEYGLDVGRRSAGACRSARNRGGVRGRVAPCIACSCLERGRRSLSGRDGARLHGAPLMLPYCRHEILDEDRTAIESVLSSDRLTQGPRVPAFEAALARRTASDAAVAVSSGTSALWVTLQGLGVGPGDEVLVPSLTFAATANAVLLAGATPVFVDVGSETLSMDPHDLERKRSPRTVGAIVVHFAGHLGDLTRLRERLGPGCFLVEDACHALGAEDNGVPAGRLGDAACFSFHPAKHITTGEGGAVTTDDLGLAERCRRFREHGIERRASHFSGLGLPESLATEERGGWVYEMQDLGANHRLSDLAAALGESQLARLDQNLAARRQLAQRYAAAFAEDDRVALLPERRGTRSAWHLYPVRLDLERIRGGRAAVHAALHARGVLAQVHYIPVHLQPYYRARFGSKWGDLPETESSYLRLLSLPMFPSLRPEEQDRVVAALGDALSECAR